MGSAGASFFYAHLILKRGGADKAIPWHQDLPYWKVGGTQIGSVWVALDDMPRAASVKYIKGGGSLIGRFWLRGYIFPRHSNYEFTINIKDLLSAHRDLTSGACSSPGILWTPPPTREEICHHCQT